MEWTDKYQLFLFDFDGLLVNTEELHFAAYKRMCAMHGFQLDWSFEHYCSIAHHDANALKEQIYKEFPQLLEVDPSWTLLYQQKKQYYLQLLEEGCVELMPGAGALLKQLQARKVKHCVVTHSPKEQIDKIRKQHALLGDIPFWITREDYNEPKPHPDSYLTAIARYANEEDEIVGFEDSPRGLKALAATRAHPVWISTAKPAGVIEALPKPITHFNSLEDLSL